MSSIKKLDLRGIVLPVALLNCSRAVSQLESHECLEILIHDPEVGDTLSRIIERSQDRIVRRVRVGGHYRIKVGPISDKNSSDTNGTEDQV
jgi:TusA-related sulfurtransferase